MSFPGPNHYPFMDGGDIPALPPPEPLPMLNHIDVYITGMGAAPPWIPDLLFNPIEDPKPFVTFTMPEPPPMLDFSTFKVLEFQPEPEPEYMPSWARFVKRPFNVLDPIYVYGEVK